MAVILLLIASIIPHEIAVRDYCDVVEVNHLYDSECRHVIDQVIWWNWNEGQCRYDVVAWRLVKSDQQLPIAGRCVWRDDRVLRDVRARIVRESWTQWDPEMQERGRYDRRELSRETTLEK